MDSLPEQALNGLPKSDRDKAYARVGLVLGYRARGFSEGDVAKLARFYSVEDMYSCLEGWGLPGLLPAKEKPERKPRKAEGEAEELPPFANAATHLRDTIRALESPYLEHMLSLKETLEGGYFVGEAETDEPNMREVRGAQWHPHPYEVVLIAVSILEHRGNWWHVERLLKELHLRPTEANRRDLIRYIYGKRVDDKGRLLKDEGDGLLDRAHQIAALVRGKAKIRPGVKDSPIPSTEQAFALWARTRVDKGGLSPEEVARDSREEWERYKEGTLRFLRKEQEAAKATSDQATVEETEREIR